MRTETPRSAEEAAEVLRACGAVGRTVRARGAGTKLDWGTPAPQPEVEISTAGLDRILEHNAGDLTAVLQAGVPLVRAQEAFARADQMLALDPPLGPARVPGSRGPASVGIAGEVASGAATIGGIVATGDSGPLRHRYGGVRDLLLGITVALADGTVARSGGKVIKNVAGYDLAKLFTGSFGTLGLVVDVAVRLHPRSERQVTVLGASREPENLQRAAQALSHAPFEMEALDIIWSAGRGSVLACFGGAVPMAQARKAERIMGEVGLELSVTEDNQALWERQRSWQRSARGAVLRVSGLPSRLAEVLRGAERFGASVVGRVGLGLFWIRLADRAEHEDNADEIVAAIQELRRELAPMSCVVLDAPSTVREKAGVWPEQDGPALELMRRVKERFDPHRLCNRGIFVGGI